MPPDLAPASVDGAVGPPPGPPASAAARRSGVVELDRGHVDVIEVSLADGRLVLAVKDDTRPGGPVYRSPAEVQLRVRDTARTTVPPGAYGFLGAPGSPVHLLPQVQDPALVWPGWSTERIGAGQVVGDRLRLRLAAVDGPGPVALFTTDQFGVPTILFDSDDGASDLVEVPVRTHAHANWAFGAPGSYRLTFEVGAAIPGRGDVTTTATYVVLVGDAAAPVAPGAVPPPTSTSAPGGPGPGAAAAAPGVAGTPALAAVAGPAGRGGAPPARAAVGVAPVAGAGAGRARLAATGSAAGGTAAAGLGLVVLGAVLVAAGGRRRPCAG